MEFRNERTWQNAVELGKTEEFHVDYDTAVDRVRSEFGQTLPMIIDGKEVRTTATFPDVSPADIRVVLGLFQHGTKAHAKHAITAARAAFRTWSATPWAERVRIVQRAADLISERKYRYAALLSFENGKNRYEAMADVDEAADLMRWYASEMNRNRGYEHAMGQFLPGETARAMLKPYGVWAVVAPFNFPFAIAGGMSTGALIAGNTVVFKPASDTPYMGLKLAELLHEAGLPPGVFNFVTGAGATVGQRLVAETQKIKVGDPTHRDVYLGPLINDAAVSTYEKAVADIRKSKGKILFGGKADPKIGHFVDPTIVAGLPRNHRINKEELFVPILSVIEVDGLDDAIDVANDVDYGLTAGIFSREPAEVRRFFSEVEAGVLYANRAAGATTGAVVGIQPFGGWKMSGTSGKSAGGHYYLPQFMREQSQSEYAG